MALFTIVEPASEPVSIDYAKRYLRIEYDDDDVMLASFITAARRWAETFTRRRFLYQTVRLEMDCFPGYIEGRLGSPYATPFASGANALLAGIRYAIQLPYPPVHAIVAFNYRDQNGGVTAVTPGTSYIADLDSEPARLMPPFGQFWPVAQVIGNAVQVDFITGYGGNVAVSMTNGSAVVAGYKFVKEDVGSAITVPGAAAGPSDLTTTVVSVDGEGVGTLAVAAALDVPAGTVAYLGEPVPVGIGIAIMMMVSHWWNNRDAVVVGDGVPQEMSLACKSLLGPYRDLRL